MSVQMSEEELSAAVVENALRVFTREEIPFLPRRPFHDFLALIALRLDRNAAVPTLDELDGLREMAFEQLSCAAFDSQVVLEAARKQAGEGGDKKLGWSIAADVARCAA